MRHKNERYNVCRRFFPRTALTYIIFGFWFFFGSITVGQERKSLPIASIFCELTPVVNSKCSPRKCIESKVSLKTWSFTFSNNYSCKQWHSAQDARNLCVRRCCVLHSFRLFKAYDVNNLPIPVVLYFQSTVPLRFRLVRRITFSPCQKPSLVSTGSEIIFMELIVVLNAILWASQGY